jgi:Zn-dependent peptidase ImmA (M78 family)
MKKEQKIFKMVESLIKKYDTRDPFALAKELGVNIIFRDDFLNLKGMYKVILRNRYIFINSKLPLEMQHLVCAHELGHDLLHRIYLRSSIFQEFVLYDMKSKPEYEANIFASELLLDDDVVYACFKEGFDVYQVANMLGVDINLLLIKVNELYKRNENLKTFGLPKSNFLK